MSYTYTVSTQKRNSIFLSIFKLLASWKCFESFTSSYNPFLIAFRWRAMLWKRKIIANKTGVFNDPLGQTHSIDRSEHFFRLDFVLFCKKWGRTDVRMDMCGKNDHYRSWLWVGLVDQQLWKASKPVKLICIQISLLESYQFSLPLWITTCPTVKYSVLNGIIRGLYW